MSIILQFAKERDLVTVLTEEVFVLRIGY